MLKKSLLPLVALLAAAAGCSATDRGSVALTSLCFPPTPQDGVCSFSDTCDPVLADGELWVDLVTSGGSLIYPVELSNMRPDNSDGALRTNTNTATFERFDLEYQAAGLSIAPASWNQTFKVPTDGTTVAVIELIPTVVGQALAAALPAGPTAMVIQVKGHGHYLDGTSFDTAWFPVSVRVYKGVVGSYTCPTGKTLQGICPQDGQTAVASCQ